MTCKKLTMAIIAITLFLSSATMAQLMASSSVTKLYVAADRLEYPAGESFKILFRLDIKNKWHTQSHTPSMDSLIATELKLTAPDGVVFGRVSYPPGVDEVFEFSEESLSTYKGATYLGVTGTVDSAVTPGKYTATAELTVQACDDKTCLPPSVLESSIEFNVVASGTALKPDNQKLFQSKASLFNNGSVTTITTSGEGDIKSMLQSSGLTLTLIFVFLGGLALNLTPCVYPLIPITVSYFGGHEESSKALLWLDALMYLLGMAAMYSALGVLAAFTGSMFGALLQHWLVMVLIASILVGLSLSMFGFYEIHPPAFLLEKSGQNKEGTIGSFFMGLTAGIIAAPCIGPFVIGLLTFVGERGDPLFGFILFFILALGLGLPFVFLAIFSGSIYSLPRSGVWMLWIRQVFGFVLIGMAFYFLEPIMHEKIYWIVLGLFMIITGVFLGWLSKVAFTSTGFRLLRNIIGIAAIALGLFFFSLTQVEAKVGIVWEKATVKAVETSLSVGKPMILDFSADWCLPCRELDHFTFADPRVKELSAKFTTYKVDLTKAGNEQAESLKEKFNVLGVPTIVFIDKNGNVIQEQTFVGYIDADEFLEKMNNTLG